MTKIYLLVAGTLVASAGFSQTRYLSPSGVDGGGCTSPGSACATITYAVSQANAGDTVLLAPGNYTFATTQNVDKSVVISAADVANKPAITSGASDVITVNAEDVVVNGLNIRMGLTAATGLRGIVVDTQHDGVTLSNNEIVSTKTISTGMVFNSYGIAALGGDGNNITITDNQIKPNSILNDAFGRGVALGISGQGNGPGGEVSGNLIQAFYSIQAVVNTADLEITDNALSGTAMIGYPANGVEVDINNNTFSGENDLVAGNLYALLEVRAVDNASINIENNTFEKYVNMGLFSASARNVSVVGNTFTPSTTATNFASIHANTKLMTSGVQNETYSNAIDIKGNTFNAGVANNGAAIVFGDHYGATTPPFAGTIYIGGSSAGDKNTFHTNLKYFIQLDESTGNSDDLQLWDGYSVTTMKPFTTPVHAYITWNTYPTSDTTVLADKVYDVNDNAALAKVTLVEPLSIIDYMAEAVTAYPNPATDVLFVQSIEWVGTSTVKIVDVQGRVVLAQNMTAQQVLSIPVAGLKAGMYTLSIENGGKFYMSRFVKK